MANPYFTCELEAWRSGQTLYGRMHYYRTDGLTYLYQDSWFPDPTMNLGGSVYTDTAFGDAVRTTGVNVGSVYTTTFSRVVAGSGTRTVTFTAGAGGSNAFEGTWSKDVVFPVPYVAPDTPTISATATGPTSISITYGTTSFGNPSTGIVTLYGDTTANPTTSIDTTNTTGDKIYTYTGLTPNTTYYFRAKANNGQLDSAYSTEITVTTPIDNRLYGSVNGQTKEIIKLYGPIDQQITTGVTGTIRAGSTQITAFDADVFFAAASPDLDLTKTLSHIQVSMSKKGTVYTHRLQVYYSDSTSYTFFNHSSDGTMADFLAYGITATEPTGAGATGYIDLTPITTTITVAKKITKLYGSVNGQTKLIFSD